MINKKRKPAFLRAECYISTPTLQCGLAIDLFAEVHSAMRTILEVVVVAAMTLWTQSHTMRVQDLIDAEDDLVEHAHLVHEIKVDAAGANMHTGKLRCTQNHAGDGGFYQRGLELVHDIILGLHSNSPTKE